MKKSLVLCAYISILSIGFTANSSAEPSEDFHHHTPCSNESLKGTYTYQFSGQNTNTTPTTLLAESGIESFDGNGNILNKSSDQGSNVINTLTGTYSINSNCTGSAIYGASHYNIFVSPEGKGFTFIQTDEGYVVAGEDKQVSKDLLEH